MKNIFYIYLNSADADFGSTTPYETTYSLGSVYNNAPALQHFQDAPYCSIKVCNFAIKYNEQNFNSDDASFVLIRINTSLPNSIDNIQSGGFNTSFGQSQIIGIVPTQASSSGNTYTTYTYSDTSYDNSPVITSNIFKGNLTIELTKQDGSRLTNLSGSNPYSLLLQVEYQEDPSLYN